MLKLKYLFIADYLDGTSFRQTPEDVSVTDPKRSCFYDVLNSGKEITRFHLTDGEDIYSVNLKDGNFEVNGKQFFAGERLPIPSKLRLIFYREHTHYMNMRSGDEVGHEIEYIIGWQTTIKGKNYQQIVRVN